LTCRRVSDYPHWWWRKFQQRAAAKMSFNTTTQRRNWFRFRHRRFLRMVSALLWCVVLLGVGTPATAQVSIEDSEIPIEENEERESKESKESKEASDLLAVRRRGRQLSPRSVVFRDTHSRVERSFYRHAPSNSGHSLPNGLSAPMIC